MEESGAPLEECEALYSSILERSTAGLGLRASSVSLQGIRGSAEEASMRLEVIASKLGPKQY